MSEAAIMRAIQIKASELGCRLFRNNVGRYRRGKYFIQYGLCVGSSDLVGWTSDGRFVAVEVKDGTPTTEAQTTFLKAVARSRGISMVCHSVDEFESQYRRNVLGQTVENAY